MAEVVISAHQTSRNWGGFRGRPSVVVSQKVGDVSTPIGIIGPDGDFSPPNLNKKILELKEKGGRVDSSYTSSLLGLLRIR